GKAPFADGTLNQKLIWHPVRNPEPVTNRRPDLPPGVVAILDRMIEKDPGLRFQSPSEVAEALAPWVQTPIDGPPEDEMPELSRAALGDGPGSSGVTRSPVRRSMPTTPPLRLGGATPTPTTPEAPKSNESARTRRRRREPSD